MKVHEIAGLTMVYQDNRVRKSKTAWRLLRELPNFPDNVAVMDQVWQEFRPELCIADFESFAYLFAREHRLPVLSIDNMQIINRCTLDVGIPAELGGSYRLAKTIVKAKLPRCDHYLITTFFFPPIRKPRTSLYPPILRQAILDARATATRGEHVLVYQTSDSFRALVPTLRELPHKFIVYGLKRDEDLGNVRLKDFSETGFVDDLKSARAVLAGGGFSLMGEAVYLGKPMLSVPLEGQFEQSLNALYLQQLGYGRKRRSLCGEPGRISAGREPTDPGVDRSVDRGDQGEGEAAVADVLRERVESRRLFRPLSNCSPRPGQRRKRSGAVL
jgi:uncharacterized protein (TIGR00661 family)